MGRPPKHAAPAAPRRFAAAAVSPLAFGSGAQRQATRAWQAWRDWRCSRPFWGAVVAGAGGLELADTSGIWRWLHAPAGLGPPPADVLLAGCLVLSGVLLCFHPVWRSAYSTVAVLAAVAALMTDHIGGYLAGAALGTVGGAMAFAWVPADQLHTPKSRHGLADGTGASQVTGVTQAAGGGQVTQAARADGSLTAALGQFAENGQQGGGQPQAMGHAPELTLIRSDAVSVPGSSPAAQRPPSAPASALGFSTATED